MTLLLGIDIGTSSVKALLFDADHSRTLAVAVQEYPIHKPTPDRAEQNAEDWWKATINAVRQVIAQAGRHDVKAIGLCGQMHGGVLLDDRKQPVCPAIIWADQRSGEECKMLIEQIGAERFASIAGTLPAAGFIVATGAWLAKNSPDILEKTQHFLLPKDYVRFHMTGNLATDVSDAAATGAFDIAQKRWSGEILHAAELPEAILPPVLESSAIAGYLTIGAAAVLGLPSNIPVVTGCADQPAQAIGSGLIAPGLASVTTGSGGQVNVPLLPVGSIPTDKRLHVFNHAVPDMYYILGAILSAGLALRWLRNLVGLQNEPNAYAILSREAATVPCGADGLIFLPYLSGERTPHMDAFARGCFVGLSYHHGRGHLARAVMEGVSFALRQALEISLSLGGQVESIITAGGGAESDVWRQIQTDIFGVPLKKSLLTEQTCIGAALLAGVGTQHYSSFHDACSYVVKYGVPTEVNLTHQSHYNALYEQYLKLYPQLRTNMFDLTQLVQQNDV
jgi:xylulokinase